MSSEPAISVCNLSKTYRIYGSPYGRVLEKLPWNKKQHYKAVHALQGMDFVVEAGQCVGIVGGNGAGKSTLLKILTGTTFPDAGSYTLRGRVASLLELGAGFHMDFTGRENIYMNSSIMGITLKETRQRFGEIVDFSELGEFIDAPLRTYSSGMVCRLGFSVAVASDPDVLIIDEILSVGDMHFQCKCVDRIFDYKNRGKTLLFCSHSLYDVRQICDHAIWLKAGRMEMEGDSVAVTNEYATFQNQLSDSTDRPSLLMETGYGEDLPRIVSARIVDLETGEDRDTFSPGENVGVRIHVKNGVKPEPLTVAVGVMQQDRSILFSATTEMDGVKVDLHEGFVTLVLPAISLLSGEFILMCGVLDRYGVHRFHQLPTEQNLIIQSRTRDLGIILHKHEWVVEPLDQRESEKAV